MYYHVPPQTRALTPGRQACRLFEYTKVREGTSTWFGGCPLNPIEEGSIPDGEEASCRAHPFKQIGFPGPFNLSYCNHSDHSYLTYNFRQDQAAAKKTKVRKFVNSRRGASMTSRLLICGALVQRVVWPRDSRSHAILCTEASVLVARQTRAVTHQPSHLTKVSASSLLKRRKLPQPLTHIAHPRVAIIYHGPLVTSDIESPRFDFICCAATAS